MNKLRFRSGQVQLVKCRVDANTIIEAGDMVWLDGDDVKPASAFPWGGLLDSQQGFATKFLGIAHQQSQDGDTTPISVDLSPLSVYEMDTPATTYEVGDMLGADEQSHTLMNQKIEKVGYKSAAIARAVEFKSTASSTLRVSFASAFFSATLRA